jgi:hypothetical protein
VIFHVLITLIIYVHLHANAKCAACVFNSLHCI